MQRIEAFFGRLCGRGPARVSQLVDPTDPTPWLPDDCWMLIIEHARADVDYTSTRHALSALSQTCRRLYKLIRAHDAVVSFSGPRDRRRLQVCLDDAMKRTLGDQLATSSCDGAQFSTQKPCMREFRITNTYDGVSNIEAARRDLLAFYYLASITTAKQRRAPGFCVVLRDDIIPVAFADLSTAMQTAYEFAGNVLRGAHTVVVRNSVSVIGTAASYRAGRIVGFMVNRLPPGGPVVPFPRMLVVKHPHVRSLDNAQFQSRVVCDTGVPRQFLLMPGGWCQEDSASGDADVFRVLMLREVDFADWRRLDVVSFRN
jgi:hypothetical protein